jgi:hypothetical protein
MKSIRLLLACLCTMFLCGQSQSLWAQEPDAQNYSQVMSVPRQEINDWLKSEIAKSGGDFDHQRYHFIVGFSTGHYGQDPVHAIAMRRLAFGLLNNSMAVGDKVTSVAWEMHIYNKGHVSSLSDDPTTRKEFVDSVPYSTEENSKGGHDMEHALYDTLTQVVDPAEAKSTIIIMLTNSNQSQGPQGENVPLFGTNNKQLADAIQKLGFRRPPTRASFDLQGKDRPLKVDVTALFPQKLESLPDAPTTSRFPTFARETWQPAADRPAPTETLPNPVAASAASAPNGAATTNNGTAATNPDNGTHTTERTDTIVKTEKQPGTPWLLYLLVGVVLIVLILVGLRALSNRPAPTAKPVVAAVPIGRPLPGAIEVTIGTQASVLMPLSTLSQWKLLRAGDTLVLQSDQPEPPKDGKAEDKKEPAPAAPTAPAPPAGRPVAILDFDEKRRLRVNAEPDTQFHDIKGFNITESNNRQLNIAPGEKLICRVATSEAPTATRLELNYNKDRRA